VIGVEGEILKSVASLPRFFFASLQKPEALSHLAIQFASFTAPSIWQNTQT
jgi:hypothetical protein